MASRQMEEIRKKLADLNYPSANAPAQSLLFAGMERYALLEWLFFRYLLFSFLTHSALFFVLSLCFFVPFISLLFICFFAVDKEFHHLPCVL